MGYVGTGRCGWVCVSRVCDCVCLSDDNKPAEAGFSRNDVKGYAMRDLSVVGDGDGGW